jgi:predicted nucleic acid-binding protein
VQNIAEFWAVATRPLVQNGLGFSVDEAISEVEKLESHFALVSESAASFTIWRKLVAKHRVSGVQVHDARIVPVMIANEIEEILTFNTADFARYTEIRVLNPSVVAT